jgi:hypothetical protein
MTIPSYQLLNRCVDFNNIWYGGDAIQWDAIIFNPIASVVSEWLRFKAVSLMHDFQPCSAMVWDCLHCWVTMVTSHTIFS